MYSIFAQLDGELIRAGEKYVDSSGLEINIVCNFLCIYMLHNELYHHINVASANTLILLKFLFLFYLCLTIMLTKQQ